MGHFAKCCATNKSVRSVTIDEEQNKGFLGTIDNKCKAWTKKFCINNKELNNPLFCSSSMVTDLTDLLVAQHFAKCPMFEHLKHFTPFLGNCLLNGSGDVHISDILR
jgi:hypothetical protein